VCGWSKSNYYNTEKFVWNCKVGLEKFILTVWVCLFVSTALFSLRQSLGMGRTPRRMLSYWSPERNTSGTAHSAGGHGCTWACWTYTHPPLTLLGWERGWEWGSRRFWLVIKLITAAAGLGSSAAAAAAAAACLVAQTALSEMKGGNAAVNLVHRFPHPPLITQPALALGLSLRGWMLKPLSLELVRGPTGP